ncbi:hypothetical protein NUACC21_42160 [Scytonema sp. NUACC21]
MLRDKQLEIQMQFLEKATDHLNTLESVVFEIKLNRQINPQKINAGLRSAHSIKGGAGIMGFQTLSNLAHLLEDSLKFFKNQKNGLEVDTDLHSLLLSSIDWLRQIVKLYSEGHVVDEQWLTTFCYPVFQELQERCSNENYEDDVTTVFTHNRLQDFISLLFQTEIEDCLQRLESLIGQGKQSVLRNEVAVMASELADLGQMLQIQAFTQLCQSILKQLESTTKVEDVARLALEAWRRSQNLIINHQLDCLPTDIISSESLLIQQKNKAEIQFSGDRTSKDSPAKVVNLVPLLEEQISSNHTNKNPTMSFPTKQLETNNNFLGNAAIQQQSFLMQIERLHKLIRNMSIRVKNLERKHHELRLNYDKATSQLSDAVLLPYAIENDMEIDGYNKLHIISSTVRETVVNIQKITNEIKLSLDDTNLINHLLNKTAQQLQKSLAQIKMRPLSDIVENFPVALRELCIEYGKNVQLKIEGGNTLIESNILEALREPLIHLMRNAFDHGIEDPATRRACGKPEQGIIEIKASNEGNRTIITVRDDGRGISLNKIRARALTMGLESSLLAQATDEELLSLIFEPGFSTSEQVTMLSGRGIGMDVVRNNLKQLRGDIKVDTMPGLGTTFTLSVPLLR